MPCWVEKNECGADLQTLQGRALRIFAGTAPSLYDYHYCMLQGLPGLRSLLAYWRWQRHETEATFNLKL